MGTRSLTKIFDNDKVLTVIYRQFDGYPDGHGIEICEFLDNKRVVNGYTEKDKEKGNFNGMGCLAAQLVKHLKKSIGNIYIRHPDVKDCWEEFTYIISEEKGSIRIECIEEKFKGTPRQFIEKYK